MSRRPALSVSMPLLAAAAIGVAFGIGQPAQAGQLPGAIGTDPPHDKDHPARMEVLHIPSGGVKINGVAYLAAGAGAHPTLGVLSRPAGQREESRPRAGGAARGLERDHVQLPRLVGEPGRRSASPTISRMRPRCSPSFATRQRARARHRHDAPRDRGPQHGRMGDGADGVATTALAGAILISAADMGRCRR